MRRAFLLNEGPTNRREWIENRLPELAEIVAISVGGFSVMDNKDAVEFTGRLFRDRKATISAELSGIFERIGSTAENWWACIEKLSKGRLLGRFFATSRARLRETATRLGLHHLANLAGSPAR